MLSKKIIWKLNIIDLLLIAIIIISICALIYKATWGGDDEYRTYEITYVCENVPIEILDAMPEGAVCSDYDTGSDLGVLKRIEYTPIIEDEPQQKTAEPSGGDEDSDEETDGSTSPRPTKTPTRANAVIVTEADGAKAEHGIKVDQTVMLKALKVDLIVGDTVLDSYVREIK